VHVNKPAFSVHFDSRRSLTAAALLATATMLAGCGKGDEATAAITKARATLASIGVSGTAAPTATRAKIYQDVISAMQGVGGSGVGTSAAKIITAQATLGQGEIAAATQRDAEGQVARLAASARILAELLVKQESLAASLEGHDQSAMLGTLRGEITKIESSLKDAEAKRSQLESALSQLTAKAGERGAMAKQKRDVAGQLRTALTEVQGEARLPIVEEAAKHQREADRFEVEQAGIELEAQAMAHQVEESRLDTQRLNRQRDLALESVKRVEDSGRLLKEQSAAARAKAGETAGELSKAFDELTTAVEQTLKPAYTEATGKYNAAASAAAGGSASDASLAKAMSGAAQQSLAALHAGYAAALEGAADVATRIGAQESLGFAAKGQQTASALMEEVKAARENAASAMAQAGASFQGTNAKGAAGDVFRKIGDRLAPPEAAPAGGEKVPDAASPDAAPGEAKPEGEPAPAEAPASDAPAAPAETPKADEPAPASDPAGSPEPK
jgi:hypothetical protein